MEDKMLPLPLTHYPSRVGKFLPVMLLTRCRSPDGPFLQKTAIMGKDDQGKPSIGTLSRPVWGSLGGSLAHYMYALRCPRGVCIFAVCRHLGLKCLQGHNQQVTMC